MPLTLSPEAGICAMDAVQAKTKYIETQVALWVLLADIGETKAAKLVDAEVVGTGLERRWISQRELAGSQLDLIRDQKEVPANQLPIDLSYRVKLQLRRYVRDARNSWSASELLSAEAADQLYIYREMIKQIVEAESRSTPAIIEANLREYGLLATIDDIEKHMQQKGTIEKKQRSVLPDGAKQPAKLAGRSRRYNVGSFLKKLYKKADTAEVRLVDAT